MNTRQHSIFTSVSRVTIDDQSAGRRLDNFLIGVLHGVPHSHVYNLIRTGQVRVNSSRAKARQRLQLGDIIRVPPVVLNSRPKAEKVSPQLHEALQRIVYEDDFILVLDKPCGVTVHSGTRHNQGLIEALRQVRDDGDRIELVHRLDKDTSGVLVLAKDHRTLRFLQSQWRRESDSDILEKNYSALLNQCWTGQQPKRIESEPQVRESKSKSKQAATGAVSYFSLVRNFLDCSLVNIELHTGKTHQARQHAHQIGQTIAGDKKYGDLEFNRRMQALGLKRMFLHASQVKIIHPKNLRTITFTAQLPTELALVIEKLEKQTNNEHHRNKPCDL